MRKVLLLTAAIIVVWLVTAWATTADSGIPEGVDVFQVGDHTCVLVRGSSYGHVAIDCFCPCEGGCDVEDNIPSPTPTVMRPI